MAAAAAEETMAQMSFGDVSGKLPVLRKYIYKSAKTALTEY